MNRTCSLSIETKSSKLPFSIVSIRLLRSCLSEKHKQKIKSTWKTEKLQNSCLIYSKISLLNNQIHNNNPDIYMRVCVIIIKLHVNCERIVQYLHSLQYLFMYTLKYLQYSKFF